MHKELLPYYERELIFVRKMAAEFAEQYPERAAALRLERDGSDDPHVERILEGFALIAGKIQHKLDEEFPEIPTALLELMYPHLLRPVPPLAMLQFAVDPELSKQRTGHVVKRGTLAYSAPIEGVQCRLRTAYEVRLWPLEIVAASFGGSAEVTAGLTPGVAEGARHGLRLELRLTGGNTLGALDLSELRVRIGGDQQAAHWVYELMFTKVKRVVLRALDKDGRPARGVEIAKLGPTCLAQVGFSRTEALLPVAETSFQGYRLMQEYFSFPQKFLFFDLSGLEQMPREAETERFEVVLLLEALEQQDRVLLLEAAVSAEMFQLGCTPAINLFPRAAEPIRLSHTKAEYAVIPDVYAPVGYEVYSVDAVVADVPGLERLKEYRPFYSLQHGIEETRGERTEAFWFAKRGASTRNKELENDMFLSFVDRRFKLSQPAEEAITVKTTCSNRDLALRLKAHVWGELDLESGALVKTRLVDGSTKTLRPALRGALQWRLISHLSLNHLSLGEGGVEALQELLRLYDPLANRSSSRQIDGLTAMKTTRKVARMDSEHGFVFSPGVAIEAELDEDKFSGGGAYLLANILERFFGLYCGVNSFTQLRVTTRQREGVVWRWPIRSGEQAVA